MSNTKKSILIYLDNYPMMAALPPEQRGWLVTALMEYGSALNADETASLEAAMERFPLSSEARLVCGFMGANIRRDTQRWLSRQKNRAGSTAPRRSTAPGPVPPPTPAQEQKIREDMERTRRFMERLKEER